MKLQIGTYNIVHALHYAEELAGNPKVIDPEGLADVIAEGGAVICGLNEVDVNAKRSQWTHAPFQIAERLRALTGERYYWAYAPAMHGFSGGGASQYGNAIVSKYPLKTVRVTPVDGGVGKEIRSILTVTLEAEGKMLTVIVTHFGFGRADVDRMLELLKAEIDASEYPVILMGDFNLGADQWEYDTLASWLKDSCAADPFMPKTFPSDKPRGKIDFIFASPALNPAEPRVIASRHSDHLPLFATVEW